MQCAQVQRTLSALLDQELDKQLEQEVLEHLAACDWCRKERDALASLLEGITPPDTITPSPWFYSKVRARIHNDTTRMPLHHLLWRSVLLSTAGVAFILTGIFLGSNLGNILLPEHTGQPVEVASALGFNEFADLPSGSVQLVYVEGEQEG